MAPPDESKKQMTTQISDSLVDAIAKARRNITRSGGPAPYLARGLFAMVFLADDTIPTAAIDRKWRVRFNPAYYEQCAKDNTLMGEIVHECLHQVLRHGTRAKAIRVGDFQRWNACADAELDQHIVRMGVKLVSDRITPQDLGGGPDMSAEELYKLAKPRSNKKCHCHGGGGVTGEAEQNGNGSSSSPGNDPAAPPMPAGLSEAEGDLVRAAIAAAINEHAASRPGSIPSGLIRWAEEFGEPPPIEWGLLLGGKVRHAVDSRYGTSPSYARPSRRQVPGGLVLPVHRAPVPTVTIVGDTSGSMNDTDIGKIVSTVHGALDAVGKLLAIGCDAATSDPIEVTNIEDLREALRGGGGTDMRKGIELAEETEPDCIVVVTDCETPWPNEAPETPVIIVSTRRGSYEASVPEWAELVLAE